MWWRKWMGWRGMWGEWMGPGGPWWGPSYEEWLNFHVKAAAWQMRGLAQFLRENVNKLDQQSKEALAKDLEELLKALR